MKKLLMTIAVCACACAACAELTFWKGDGAPPVALDAAKTFELRVGEAPKTGDVSLLVALGAPVDDTFRPTVTLNGVPAATETRAPLATWLPGFDATPVLSPKETREIQAGYRYSFPLSALKTGGNTVALGPAVGAPKLHALALDADPAEEVVVENSDFRLAVGKDALVKSLVVKKTGEECVDAGMKLPLFTVTQDRPFHNELKLIHPNKRTVYPATRLRREGDFLYAGFGHDLYEAKVTLKTAPGYAVFTLADFPVDRKPTYDYLRMDLPPVASFRIQLPVKNRANFGDWLNAGWDAKAAVGVVGTSPHPDIDHETRAEAKILYAEATAGVKLRGAGAALLAAPGREAFLDAMDTLEKDFGLPRGVKSRRSPDVQEAIFHVCAASVPADVDELVSYAKKGGFKLMTFSYGDVFKCAPSWGLCGNYDWKDSYPDGEADVKAMLAKVKAAGIKAGFHTLHSHIGLQSRYVTPVADPRLNKTRRFTLAAPLSAATNDTEITVCEPTDDVVMYAPCRILQFGGELVSYESYTAEPPYKFLGVKRGAHKTQVAAHPHGEVGGILDISEFGTPMSCYADQNTDLQDEVAAKLARAYNCGFEYVYLDGSEGVNRPFNYHVANAQLRYWKLLTPEPSFGEGAAKTHFGWHMLAGANAFDTFPPEVFKAKLREFPFKQAPITQQDMSRVDFGWWAFCSPSGGARPSVGTQADMWEYGASVAAAWDCAISIRMPASALKRHPRADDILEMMRRWGDCRRRGLFKDEWRPRLKNYAQEHHLVVDAKGDYDLVDYWPLAVGNGQTPVRAFVFQKDGATWVVYWHGSGEGRLRLPIAADAAALYDDFAGKSVAFEKDGGSITVPATKRLYLKTTLARDAVERAFAAAALLPPGNAPFLGFNEDDTHYYGRADRVNPEGFRKYIDDICRGKVTDFFICANAQRSIVSSKVFDSAWKDKPDPAGYGLNLKNLEATGTDAIRLWIETCRAKGIRPWVSMRMNDIHDVDDFDHPLHSSFWRNHPECWVVPGVGDLKNSTGCWRSLDYAQKPVYDYHLAFVKELIDRYGDAEGIELDWLRGVYCLTRGKQKDLHPVLTRFMRDVRAYASTAGEKRGRKIRVAARVPSDPDAAASYGFRPVDWAKEGLVDLLIPCNHYGCSDFLLPYRDWRARLAAVNPAVQVVPGTDSGINFLGAGGRRMMTPDEYYGWADGLFAEGARDLYLFNLYENPPDSVTWNEILSHGFDAAKVAAHRRRYAITYRDVPGIRPDYGNLLPANWAKGVELTVRVGTPPKTGGKVAVLAAFDGAAPDDFAARVALNGVSPIGGAPEPPANWLNGTKANMTTVKQSADPQFGYLPQNMKSSMRYAFPAEAVQRGTNALVVKPAGEGSLRLMCLELEIAP